MRNYIKFKVLAATIGIWDQTQSPPTNNAGFFFQLFIGADEDECDALLNAFLSENNSRQNAQQFFYIVADEEIGDRWVKLDKDFVLAALNLMTNLSAPADFTSDLGLFDYFNTKGMQIVDESPRGWKVSDE